MQKNVYSTSLTHAFSTETLETNVKSATIHTEYPHFTLIQRCVWDVKHSTATPCPHFSAVSGEAREACSPNNHHNRHKGGERRA